MKESILKRKFWNKIYLHLQSSFAIYFRDVQNLKTQKCSTEIQLHQINIIKYTLSIDGNYSHYNCMIMISLLTKICVVLKFYCRCTMVFDITNSIDTLEIHHK